MNENCFAKLAVTVATTLFVAGCVPTPAPKAPVATDRQVAKSDHDHPHKEGEADHAHPHKKEGGHSHGAGPHHGTLADWGGGKYHVEFTIDHEKQEATVYILGTDEKTAVPIKTTDGKLLLTISEPKFQTDLVAQPLDGEKDGASSRFVGKHESLGKVQEFEGTISAEVDGTPFTGDFKEEPHTHSK